MNKEIAVKNKEFTKYENVYLRIQKGLLELNTKISEYENRFEWIPKERSQFGQKNGLYDFDSMDMHKLQTDHESRLENQNNMKKKVNMKVEAMSDKVEKEYKQLLEKRDILETDKLTINTNIEELDKKKKKTLEKCYIEVN